MIDSITTNKIPTMRIEPLVTEQLADLITPVSAYLRLRGHYQQALLLESNDFHSAENCFSYIALEPLASFEVKQSFCHIRSRGHGGQRFPVENKMDVPALFAEFQASFNLNEEMPKQLLNGLFGFSSFESASLLDNVKMDRQKPDAGTPDMYYAFYRFILAFDHFRNRLFIIENCPEGDGSQMPLLQERLMQVETTISPFQMQGTERSNLTDEAFMDLVTKGKQYCKRGDVFQIVFSRQFQQDFSGDEFQVYRVLRSINPSPYLFYFDYGNYKIFGSSPESQLVIENGRACVHPIAGTYKRTGNDTHDREKAQALVEDPKENAEHIMLVDLARNDLSRHTKQVRVSKLKEIQYFSHVIHLVSEVEGQVAPETSPFQIFADTFPAGTLSGAPKIRAMELISQHENQQRGCYGGAIGFIGFDQRINTAIIIRSFLSKDHTLHFQAGAGIVMDSKEEMELQEVTNKLGALKKALALAVEL